METYFNPIEEGQAEDPRERLARDLKAVVQDAENLLQATASDVGEKAREARTRLTEALERAKATCQQMEQKAAAAARAADKVIRSHPYESIGVAFGLGLLVGVLVSRK